MKYYLLAKTHNKTGLKYLCKCMAKKKEKCFVYKGSGKYWKRHLEKHGKDITTKIIFETNSLEQFKRKGLYYSKLWNVTKSNKWANLCDETGINGGRISFGRDHYCFGKPAWNRGKPASKEQKQKMSKSLKGKLAGKKNPWYGKIGKDHPSFGRKHSKATKRKIGLASRARMLGSKMSEETKKKISDTFKRKRTPKFSS